MFHSLKRIWLAGLLLAVISGVQSAYGFALLGPFNEAFQVNVIGYNLVPPSSDFANDFGADVGAPKNVGQGYRWNLPTLFYACDSTFQSYFGSNGVAAVDSAYAVLNSLTNVSSYSATLAEWPLDSTGNPNYTAEALSLVDVKSTILSLMVEQLGLAQPDRWTWCLHDRFTSGLTCPNFAYIVIQRNYDPVTQVYSSYVNGTLYDYQILELCGLNPNLFAPLEADAIEITLDPTTSYTAVAASGAQQNFGTYYNGFTRDDMGGLRTLYAATNKFIEAAAGNSQLLFTNQLSQLLTTSSLQLLNQQALTNPPGALQALFPNLAITSFTNYFTNQVVTNIEAFYITNGSPPVVFVTNLTTNVETLYSYTFGNVVTNHVYTNGFLVTQVTNVGPNPFAPILITNQFGTLLTTSNLALLTEQSLTNDPAALQTLYPNLVINSFTNLFTNVITTNITAYFTNPPFAPAGVAVLKLATNYTTNVGTFFNYTFANVVTNHLYTNAFITTQETNIAFSTSPFGPVGGSLNTNITTKTKLFGNIINGDYYIIPTNLWGYDILSTQLVTVVPITNTVVFATNSVGVTNVNGQSFTMNIISYFTNYFYITYPIVAFPGPIETNVVSTTNITSFVNGDYYIVPPGQFGYQVLSTQLVSVVQITNVFTFATNAPGVTATNLNFTENLVTFSTNYTLIEYPIQYVPNAVALREGIEKINFVRRDFDSLLNTFWDPITNFYKLTAVTNGAPFIQNFRRVVTQPDIVFSAADLAAGPAGIPTVLSVQRSNPNYNSTQAPNGQPGPGTMGPSISFIFDEVGPAYFNGGPFFNLTDGPLSGLPASGSTNSTLAFLWGTFDGTTNAPIAYPDGTDLASLESQVFFQILSSLLPVGSISGNNAGNPYSAQLQAQGASPPFTWALTANSAALPAGLSVSSDGVISGVLSSAVVGTYNFTVQATDSTGRVAQLELFIEVDP